ncbi:MAG: UDP-glucose 4-epimerase GalE [Acidimicrobiales bacterium]|nr:UDP-glucose 4-epimerase GalE [Acidimicrobiales bacterium]
MRILVTGGAGYIGSHTVVLLIEAGHEVVIVDDFSNSKPEAVRRIAGLTGRAPELCTLDLLDADGVDAAVAEHGPEAVIHFAGLKAVGESVAQPLRYYRNNLVGTLNLLTSLDRHGCRTLVFSSSATVYGPEPVLPLREDAPTSATNPYGWSKYMIEQILADLAAADRSWSVASLRYFNPVGAHPSGRIGEDPQGIPNNLLPFVTQVAVGRRERLDVFGDDYDTPDGTGVRDYLHVVDLAAGHLAALHRLVEVGGHHVWNLGTGQGHSVYEVIAAFERATGIDIPHRVVDRRPGDIAASYADPTKANEELGWTADRTIDTICADAWRWQSQNPEGYPGD